MSKAGGSPQPYTLADIEQIGRALLGVHPAIALAKADDRS